VFTLGSTLNLKFLAKGKTMIIANQRQTLQEKQRSTKAKSNIFSFNKRKGTSSTGANCPNQRKKAQRKKERS